MEQELQSASKSKIAIGVLIIEDDSTSSQMIRLGIDEFNKESSEFGLNILSDFDSAEGAETFIRNQTVQLVRLIFLDIELNGVKNGIDFIRSFPNLAYIVVSKDEKAAQNILNETSSKEIYYFVEKAGERVFTLQDIVMSINKFVSERGKDFYTQVLKDGRDLITLKEIAFISKTPLKVIGNLGKKEIVTSEGRNFKKDSHFYITNVINPLKGGNGDLIDTGKDKTPSNFSITNIIAANNLNPKQFLVISQSIIINVDYFHIMQERHNILYMRLKNINGDVIATLPYSPQYMTRDKIAILKNI